MKKKPCMMIILSSVMTSVRGIYMITDIDEEEEEDGSAAKKTYFGQCL